MKIEKGKRNGNLIYTWESQYTYTFKNITKLGAGKMFFFLAANLHVYTFFKR